jgi:hypothetical protein
VAGLLLAARQELEREEKAKAGARTTVRCPTGVGFAVVSPCGKVTAIFAPMHARLSATSGLVDAATNEARQRVIIKKGSWMIGIAAAGH